MEEENLVDQHRTIHFVNTSKMQNSKGRNIMTSSICIDFGLGFLKENTHLVKCELDNSNFRFKFFLDDSREIRAINWKVYEPYGCRCRVNLCKLDGNATEIIALNAENDDTSLFLSENPQYKVDVLRDFYHIFEVEGKLQYLEAKDYFYEICRYKQYIDILLAENNGLYTNYKDFYCIKEENNNLKTDRNWRLIAKLRRLNRHKLSLKAVCIGWRVVVKLRKCKDKIKNRWKKDYG